MQRESTRCEVERRGLGAATPADYAFIARFRQHVLPKGLMPVESAAVSSFCRAAEMWAAE